MKKFIFLSLILLLACSHDGGSDGLGPGSGVDGDGGSDSADTEGGDDDGGDDGTHEGSGSGGTSDGETDATGETGGGSGSGETTSDPDGPTGSSGDGGDSTDSESDSSSSGGNTTTGQVGEEKFPGDWCDPLIDWCLDAGGDYECLRDSYMLPNNEYEVIYECKQFNDLQGDGTYGEPCHLWPNESCRTGLACWGDPDLPNCAPNGCCIYLCKYQEICADGQECVPVIWQAQLADYLDHYAAIGYCPQ